MNVRYISRTDLVVAGTGALSLTILLIDVKLTSVIPLYFNGLVFLGISIYWAIRGDATDILKRSLIIGGIAGFLYTFVDSLFVDARITVYLRLEDIDVFKTPVSVVLVWIQLITAMTYLYQRLRSRFAEFYMPSTLTGVSAFLLGLVMNYLAYHARLWVWDVGVPPLSIGPVPLFVPAALFLTSFLSPYIIGGQRASMMKDGRDSFWARFLKVPDNPIVGGIRYTVILTATLYLLLLLFTRLSVYLM